MPDPTERREAEPGRIRVHQAKPGSWVVHDPDGEFPTRCLVTDQVAHVQGAPIRTLVALDGTTYWAHGDREVVPTEGPSDE